MNNNKNNNTVLYKDPEFLLLKPIYLANKLFTHLPFKNNNVRVEEAISNTLKIYSDLLYFFYDKNKFNLIFYFLTWILDKPFMISDGIINAYLNKDNKISLLNNYLKEKKRFIRLKIL